jgi:hypothetical protein
VIGKKAKRKTVLLKSIALSMDPGNAKCGISLRHQIRHKLGTACRPVGVISVVDPATVKHLTSGCALELRKRVDNVDLATPERGLEPLEIDPGVSCSGETIPKVRRVDREFVRYENH